MMEMVSRRRMGMEEDAIVDLNEWWNYELMEKRAFVPTLLLM